MITAAPPKLSICIPTYNRSACLAELLDSIIAQGAPDVEVVIGDDASTDDTMAVVESYRRRFKRFTAFRQPTNVGFDRNFLAVVEAASGDYIWLMGDDDRLEPEGARQVLDALGRWPGVRGLTLGVIDYDDRLRTPIGVRLMPPTQRIEGVGPVFEALAEHLGFMSALVIDRRAWSAIASDPAARAYENYYIQVYIIGRAIGSEGAWGVVNEPCVGFRTSNDQLLSKVGWFDRLKIDVAAYDQLGLGLFGGDLAARRSMRRKVFDTHVMARVVNAKTQAGVTPMTMRAARFLFLHYRGLPAYWTKALPMLFAPKWLTRFARMAYQRINPTSGAARARKLANG